MNTQATISRRSFLIRTAGAVGAGALAAAGITVATQGAAVAEAGIFPGTTVFVDTDALNLRTDAALASDVIATYPYGTTATIIEKSVDNFDDNLTWVPVEITDDGTTGWFAFEYLTVTDGGGGGGYDGAAITVIDGPLNLRDTPALSGGVIASYAAGATGVQTGDLVNADGYQWMPVQMGDGNSGFVAAEFVSYGGSDGGGSDRPVVTVIDGPLNLRDGAGLSAPIVATYDTGATGVYTGTGRRVTVDGYDWINVVMDDGNAGMFATEFISVA